ncbi:MAG: Na+/H+ antiporter NhaC family protein [Clostridia bacterium]|nr:Na+/H+ antiporter NhaC family protein [Clostridia bacterium]MBR5753553.1 Na+/H+ antiporter NhaC family protein [Clostridia bacterium]
MSEKVSVKVNIGTASTEPTPTEPKSAEPAPKKKFKLNAIQIGAICFVVLFAILCAALAPVTSAAGTLWALFPPVVAIGLALITKEVYSSLLIGTLVGAALAAKFSPAATMDYLINDAMISAVSGTAGIFLFLVFLGIIVSLLNKSGGSAAFGRWAQSHIKTRVGAMLATFALGVLIFIDDYFNCLTVGAVMKPVTDTHKISRAKLAYLIDATAAPICMIAPISSWAAAVSGAVGDNAAGISGIKLFCMAIPYNFYSLLSLVFVIAISKMQFDYGPMRRHEWNALNRGDFFTEGERAETVEVKANEKSRIMDLVLPVIVLIFCCAAAMLYVGGFFSGVDFITAFSDTDATVALPWGAIIALVFTIIYLLARKLISFKEAMTSIPEGFIAMIAPIIILTLATSLKNLTTGEEILNAKGFVAGAMSGVAGGLESMLPAIIFLVAVFIAFATGTSWGTFGILIPIVCNVFQDPSNPLFIIGVSACLAGAVCGDHCSPISDTTIMSSAGAECNHLNHVNTQLPYALTVAGVSFVSFIIAGFLKNVWFSLPIAILLTLGTLLVMKGTIGKKEFDPDKASKGLLSQETLDRMND